MTTLQSLRQYATAQDLSERQVLRYLADDRLPGAVKIAGTWSIPAEARPVPTSQLATVTSPDVTPDTGDVPQARVVPPGLWELRDVALYLGTSVPGLRRLVADGHVGVIGPYGDLSGDRLWVAPPGTPRPTPAPVRQNPGGPIDGGWAG